MISIINGRDTGKTKQLLDLARRKHATILTMNKRAFIVKAKSLGYEDIDIIDYEDLNQDLFNFTRPLVIHQVDNALKYLFDFWYNSEVIGYSANVNLSGIEKQLQPKKKEKSKWVLLKYIKININFRAHFMGHYHQDKTVLDKYHILYNDIIEIMSDGTLELRNN